MAFSRLRVWLGLFQIRRSRHLGTLLERHADPKAAEPLLREAEAEPLLVESERILATKRGGESREARDALRRLTQLYDATGRRLH